MSACCVFALHLHLQEQNPPHKQNVGTLGAVHISSRGNLLAQKRACRVENARKVSNLAALFALQTRFCTQNLTHG